MERVGISEFIEELRSSHPDVVVELLDEQSPWVDQRVRIKCASYEEVDDVAETVAQLTTKYYLDEGVYITGATYHPGSEQW